MSRCLVYVPALVLVASSIATGAAADTVRLANGNRFENVVAEETANGVLIRFSYGDMVLPRSLVAGVDKGGSTLADYLAAASRLDADPTATAGDWLQLALAARGTGLEDGYRRALLRAAELDPSWPGLTERLNALDYVWDEERGRWVPFAESRAARREAERRQVAAEASRQAARDAERQRLVEAIELLALARLTRELEERPAAPERVPGGIPVVTYVGTGFPGSDGRHGGSWGWPATEHNRETVRELERRQPGSLLPVGPAPRHNRSGMAPPGTAGEPGTVSGQSRKPAGNG